MMKNSSPSWILTLFVLLLSTAASVAQQNNKTVFKGSIKNAQRDFIMLRQQGRADTVKLNKEGNFELMIEQNTGNYFTIEHQKQSLQIYLLPADVVNISANAVNLLDASITGNSAPYCNYLIEKQKADKGVQNQYPNFKVGLLSGERFYAIRDSIKEQRNATLTKAKATNSFVDAFSVAEQKILDYQMGLELMQHQTQATKMGQTVFPAMTEKYIASLSLNDETVSFDSNFKSFVINRVSGIATALYYAGTDKSVLRYYELVIENICREISSDKNKSIIISEFMPQLMNDVGTNDLRNIIAQLEACSSDKKLIASVKKFASQYEYLYPGKPAPDAAFFDANGKTSRISDYKGKVIYIDAWATWCGPCKREIPHLKTLEEEFHGKNIQFISVSTDKDLNAWKNFIAKESMGGLQLHQSDNPKESISQLYIVNSIPRFILIDEAGNIVKTDAPRPSSGDEIRNLLNSLLAD